MLSPLPTKNWMCSQFLQIGHNSDFVVEPYQVQPSFHSMQTLEEGMSKPRGRSNIEDDQDESVVVIRTTKSKLRELEENLAKEIQNLNVIPKNLGYLNLTACACQFLQAIFLLIFASRNESVWYWYTNFQNPDTHMPEPHQVAAFSVLWLSPVFIISSGIEHLCSVIFRDTYQWYLQRNQNPFRWAEYSFSASLMRVLVAQLVGVTDVHILFFIFLMTALMIQLGSAHESINAKSLADGYQQNWRVFWLSWAAQMSTWFVIFNYFAKTVQASQSGSTTSLLWVIVIFIFMMDNSFGALFTFQWCQWEPVGKGRYTCVGLIFRLPSISKFANVSLDSLQYF